MRTVTSLPSVSISIVSFSPNMSILRRTLATLRVALEYAREQKSLGEVFCWLIDNGPGHAWKENLQALLEAELGRVDWRTVKLISGQGYQRITTIPGPGFLDTDCGIPG